MPKKRLEVISESDTGRNEIFRDTKTGEEMTRAQTVKKINEGIYDDYHTRKIHGLDTPVSNPDKDTGNNLG